MAYLASPSATKAIINSYSFAFQKKFGQNFLIDANILENIMEEAGITDCDFVLEIGPGIGTMTQYLCENAREVLAVEIDSNLIPILNYTLQDYDNVEIINEDALKIDIDEVVKNKNNGNPMKVVANLPYYITTPIVMGLLESKAPIDSITIMVQKEVAERMQTGPGSKHYGALSLAVQYFAKAEVMMEVSASCFMPRPKVDSSVIKLSLYDKPPVNVCDEEMMFKIIRASFNQRRKTLVNGLKNAANLPFTKEKIEEAIEKLGMPLTVRGETLTLEEFAKLTDILLGEEMKTTIAKVDPNDIDKKVIKEAGLIIKNGGLVAFPTETVYGLGADALNEEASKKIYEAKGRPSDNPLIVHIASKEMLYDLVEDVDDIAEKLMDKFWPGPMTLIFNKKEIVPSSTTGGLDTVAIRFPSNEIAQELIKAADTPIAAPSANISGKPSPTVGSHVVEDMDGRVDMIIDGGVVGIGLESTIIDVTGEPSILRPGYITQEMLKDTIGNLDTHEELLKTDKDFKPKAPGMKYKHYAPKGELVMVKGDANKVAKRITKEARKKKNVGIITVDEHMGFYKDIEGVNIVSLGSISNLESIAHELFKVLRDFDKEGIDYIYSEVVEEKDLGVAIMNRLSKAAGYRIIEV